jgi:hypothetical protein
VLLPSSTLPQVMKRKGRAWEEDVEFVVFIVFFSMYRAFALARCRCVAPYGLRTKFSRHISTDKHGIFLSVQSV